MKRRSLLKVGATMIGASALGYGGLILGGAVKSCGDGRLPGVDASESLANIGRTYLQHVATPKEITELRQLLYAVANDAGDSLANQIWYAAVELAGSSTEDFRTGNTVVCEQWVLARGEARSCALLALGTELFPQIILEA